MNIVRTFAKGKVLNLFAGKNVVNEGEYRVDLDNSMPLINYRGDATDFLNITIKQNYFYDTIIYDPPWNERKSKEFYNERYIGKFTKLKDYIVKILNVNGIIISVGYEIDNFSRKRGMKLESVFVVNPSGEIRPFFITIERKLPIYKI